MAEQGIPGPAADPHRVGEARPVPVDDVPGGPPPGTLRYRPRRIRQVAWLAAVVVVLAAVALAVALPGGASGEPAAVGGGVASFGAVDRVAVVGLGVFGAAILLSLTRPLVEADVVGIRVRNVVGDHRLPWPEVVGVRFDHGASWATLELPDGELLGVVAVQSVDTQRAVAAVRMLRTLHRQATGPTG